MSASRPRVWRSSHPSSSAGADAICLSVTMSCAGKSQDPAPTQFRAICSAGMTVAGRGARGAHFHERSEMAPAMDETAGGTKAAGGAKSFRFYDNREKYLLFVTTC